MDADFAWVYIRWKYIRMYFADLRLRLLEDLRLRIHNGELTERSLARLVSVSQPHIHNVLKGRRIISPEMCDRILARFGMSILDLIRAESGGTMSRLAGGHDTAWVKVLEGR